MHDSQKHNGIVEFEFKSGEMICGAAQAKETADKINARYGNGISYIETDLCGSPELELGSVFESYSKHENPSDYECLSNDFTYDGGLKVKTKARKIAASNNAAKGD